MTRPTVISTFAGAGGSSLGYHLAGYHELLAVEWDADAVATFRANFPGVPVHHGDITQLTGDECLRLAGVQRGELDVLDGSPPCQGFSTAGKRQYDDPRNSLFIEYARLLRELQPRAFVMENVTGMVKGHMKQAYLAIMATLRDCGYDAKGQVLNAMHYGVPQSRQRVIIVGFRSDLGIKPSHPKPQTRPITVRQALEGVKRQNDERTATPLQRQRWAETKPGDAHPVRFSFLRLAWDKPAPTILKVPGSGGHFHPSEPRLCDTAELKRLASFPDDFQLGTWENCVARIGNSVPPLLMRAVAQHVRDQLEAAA